MHINFSGFLFVFCFGFFVEWMDKDQIGTLGSYFENKEELTQNERKGTENKEAVK